MSWTAPKTFTAASVLTAAELNTHLRDNLLETCPATVTTAGDMTYADGANSMGSRLAIGAAGSILVSDGTAPVFRTVTGTQQNGSSFDFTNTSYLDLDAVTGGTPGTSASVTVTTGTQAIVLYRSRLQNDTAGGRTYLSFRISGATTEASNDNKSIVLESSAANDLGILGSFKRASGLTVGSNTFTLQARATTGTSTMQYTEIVVIPL